METSSKKIEVVMDLNELQKIRGGGNQERHINDTLRKAGIPMKGIFSFDGVARGTLQTNANFETNKFTFVWEDDKPFELT